MVGSEESGEIYDPMDGLGMEEKGGSVGEAEKQKELKYPTSIYFIMGNEFCERFSFYGMRAVLVLYLHQFLLLDENTAVSRMHLFTAGAYVTTLLGAFISDSYLGRYRTILYISLVYVLGSAVMSVTAIPGVMGDPPAGWGAGLGLALIAVGTGGIKPCVSSFVGDQIAPGQEALLASVFSLFYFFINSGSTLSTFLTPLFREYMGFAVAFGVPAILLAAAVLIFFLGRHHYRIVPPGPNVLLSFWRVVSTAFVEWWPRRQSFRDWAAVTYQSSWIGQRIRAWRGYPPFKAPGTHFLDFALYRCDPRLVSDVKATLAAFSVFIPMPIYWSIYDQSSSRWIFQASHMDLCLFGSNENGYCLGGVGVQPDQVSILNPILVLLLIPLFNRYFYPWLERLVGPLHPLNHKMIWGMILNAVAIVLAAILAAFVEASPGGVSIYWQIPQWVVLSAGEVMVSITGLEFSFAAAPPSMKSLVMAGWLLTVAIGNLLVATVAESNLFTNLSLQMVSFAITMLLFVAIFKYVVADFEYVIHVDDTPAPDPASDPDHPSSLRPHQDPLSIEMDEM